MREYVTRLLDGAMPLDLYVLCCFVVALGGIAVHLLYAAFLRCRAWWRRRRVAAMLSERRGW